MDAKRLIVAFFGLSCAFALNPTCPSLETGMTNVHLICHTHDDVGWLKTVDQYFYGSQKGITWVGVQYILDSVVPSLLKDPSRKFIFVESAFFTRWWKEQDSVMQSRVEQLVDNGQLEFVSGGWCMNDEAATHYTGIIDQMTIGLKFLNDTFGSSGKPSITWQIDPFGHSKEQASLFAQMGMDALFLGRIDYADKSNRLANKQMEMIWKASDSLGQQSWLFTGVLPNNYSPPSGFCFDLLCNDDPIMDDPDLEDYNVDKMIDNFLQAVADQQANYVDSNIIMTMGDDFDYMNAEAWYKNLDKLILYTNARQVNGSNVNVVYSSPSCYVEALQAAGHTWPTKSDDFFPYASDPHAFWTGYFTSRPSFKGYVRQTNNFLQASKQLAALSGADRDSIEDLAEVAGVIQHHDAVTGTERQHVTDDYSTMIYRATVKMEENNKAALRNLIPGSTASTEFVRCPLLNISSCAFTETLDSFAVTVYNPLGRSVSSYVRIPVSADFYNGVTVTDSQDSLVESQTVLIPQAVSNIPGRESSASFEVVFLAEDVPPLGVAQFKVVSDASSENRERQRSKTVPPLSNGDYVIENEKLSLYFDGTTKRMKLFEVKTEKGVKSVQIDQEWMWYKGFAGSNYPDSDRASGAYIFRPDGDVTSLGAVQNISVLDGPVVSEVQQQFGDYVSQVLRLYKNSSSIEIEWIVGPIPIDDNIGKEIVTRFNFDEMDTNTTFYTDANGREMQKRILDYRPTWNLDSTEPISQNYYPVTSRMMVSSINGQGSAAILNDRAQGGTSRSNGQMEIMVHRRLLYDDAKGVAEPLNERQYLAGLVVRGKHHVLHSSSATPDCDFDCLQRTRAEEIFAEPMLTFSSLSSSSQQMFTTSGLQSSLPDQIHLLTLEPWGQQQWLMRLENFFEQSEGGINVDVDLETLFSDWTICNTEELILGANQYLSDFTSKKWKILNEEMTEKTIPETQAGSIFTLSPMQIRTFLLNVVPSGSSC